MHDFMHKAEMSFEFSRRSANRYDKDNEKEKEKGNGKGNESDKEKE